MNLRIVPVQPAVLQHLVAVEGMRFGGNYVAVERHLGSESGVVPDVRADLQHDVVYHRPRVEAPARCRCEDTRGHLPTPDVCISRCPPTDGGAIDKRYSDTIPQPTLTMRYST